MAEPRRVELKTITSTNGEKKDKICSLTQRFTLALGESTASTCPEFSFTELVKKEKSFESNPDDPFGEDENHDEVAAIARQFEEKYGPKPKKKLKCLENDFFDLGDGYDENDPFIDNTEAYDEVVPSCLTTKHGGFYINRGTLDFKTLSEPEDSCEEFAPTVRKRGRPKKILDSGSEQDDNGETKKRKIKRKRLKEELEGEKKKKKRISFGPDGEKIVKKRRTGDSEKKKKMSPTVAELLKQQTASTSAVPYTTNGNIVENVPVQSSERGPPEKIVAQDKIELAVNEGLLDDDDKNLVGVDGGNPLPTNLPSGLASTIYNIKQAARDTKEGKCKFFSGDVNRMLLDIELASRQLTGGHRSSIYAHLADHLPCGKETLIKRAKKLRESQQDDQLKVPLQRLREAVNEVMPALQEQHEQEALKARLESKERGEDQDVPKEEGANTESDEEEKAASGIPGEGQSKKGNRGPRKKFKWTPEIKKLLCSIVNLKMQMFETFRIRNQTAEEFLKIFLDNEVKPIWPQGWMQTRTLFKESRSVHGNWTNPQKPKKPVLVTKTATSPPPFASSPENVLENKSVKSGSTAVADDVIELSDTDEPIPLASSKENKVVKVPTILDIADDSPLIPKSSAILNTSPKTIQAIAAATAAAVVSAVSAQKSDPDSIYADHHHNLVTEILKGTIDPISVSKAPATPSLPLTPSTPVTPLAKEKVFSPFLAEFDRYLISRQSASQQDGNGSSNSSTPQPSSSKQLSSLQQLQIKQHQKQLQSRAVSSSSEKIDISGDAKSVKQSAPIKWHMEGILAVGKADKTPGDNLSASSDPTVKSGAKASPLLSEPGEIPSDQSAQLKKMYSLLQGNKVLDPSTNTRAAKVQEHILSKIKADLDIAKNEQLMARSPVEIPSTKSMPRVPAQPPSKFSASSNSSSIRQPGSISLGLPVSTSASSNQRHSFDGNNVSSRQSAPFVQSAASGLRHPLASSAQVSHLSPTGNSSKSQEVPGKTFSPFIPRVQLQSLNSASTSPSSPKTNSSGGALVSMESKSSKDSLVTVSLPSSQRNLSPGQHSSSSTSLHKTPAGRATVAQRGVVPHGQGVPKQRSSFPGQKATSGLEVSKGHAAPGQQSSSSFKGEKKTLTVYEQIENHVKQQAAMEQQALQNLALASLYSANRNSASIIKGAWQSQANRLLASPAAHSLSMADLTGTKPSKSSIAAHSSYTPLNSVSGSNSSQSQDTKTALSQAAHVVTSKSSYTSPVPPPAHGGKTSLAQSQGLPSDQQAADNSWP